MSYSKSINIFLKDGTADGFVTAELENWNGKAIKVPRSEMSDYSDREDLKMAGVYFLFCKSDDGNDSVYIGEAEDVYKRLNDHLRAYKQGKEAFYWNTALAFTGPSLNKTLIRYLEYRLFDMAIMSGNYSVLTKNVYRDTKVSESQEASMDQFIDNIRIIISTLGFKVLDIASPAQKADIIFKCTRGGSDASCFISKNGVTVRCGSKISDKTTPSFEKCNYKKLREKLIKNRVINKNLFTIDYEFDAPSAAAAVVIGAPSNGRKEWRDPKTKKTLGEYL